MNTQILIEPVIDGNPYGFAVQAKAFQFDLKITNNSNNPSESFTMSRIVMTSAQGQDINDDFERKSFLVGSINPGESTIIKIGKNGQFMFGLISVNISIIPSDVSKPITFFQKNPFTKNLCDIQGVNHWIDFFYIKSSSEDLQEKTNKWLIILTWVIAVSTLITICPIIISLFNLR